MGTSCGVCEDAYVAGPGLVIRRTIALLTCLALAGCVGGAGLLAGIGISATTLAYIKDADAFLSAAKPLVQARCDHASKAGTLSLGWATFCANIPSDTAGFVLQMDAVAAVEVFEPER